MVDVFISYSRSNRDRVQVLAEAVKTLGYRVWWDDELPPHKSYGDVITEQIAGANAAIVCWSADAAQSEWVRAEADLARNQKKLIQISYDDVMPPMPFNQIQFASLADWQGEADHSGWRKVQASLTDLCGPPGSVRAPVSDDVRPSPRPAAAPPPQSYPPPPSPAPAPEKSGLSPALLGLLAVVLLAGIGGIGWMVLGGDKEETVSADGAQDGDAGPAGEGEESADEDAGRYRLAAMIDDPDGYSNIRAEPSSDARILARVNEGEAFTTYEQDGQWWQVRTADGVTGYMARSRIRLLRDGVPVAAPVAAAPTSSAPAPTEEWSDAAPAGPPSDGQIIPDSATRRLTLADIAGLGPVQLRLARNEIYARKGKRFRNPALRQHFSRLGWYRPVADDVSLSAIEQANVDLISAAEQGR